MFFVSEWSKCNQCGKSLQLEVLHCAAGYFVGCLCKCGEETQESGLFHSYSEAENALKSWMLYEGVQLEQECQH